MKNVFQYPFDSSYLMKKKSSLKDQLIFSDKNFIEKKIAILGGSTTHDIVDVLELFLLNYGIKPIFYESEFNKYWEDAMFGNEKLDNFMPDIIFIHTSNRNITEYPTMKNSDDEIKVMLESQYNHFEIMWKRLSEKFGAIIIQNNFELPFFRLMGNKDATDIHGRVNFITRLNMQFYEYAQKNSNFFINDINYLSSSYGLEKWADPFYWYMYKYILNFNAIPEFSFNLANIIKSLYGNNKKAFVLDLDNTLWGGVVGDDGVEGIDIGQETSIGQAYIEFQTYLKLHKDLGIMLSVNSKNDYDNAIKGLNHPSGMLKPEDFAVIKANWQNKDQNIKEIANEFNILPESLVFVDDNIVERDIVGKNVYGVSVPEIENVEQYINIIDKNGYFEVTNFSSEDLKRNEMYKENKERLNFENCFEDYHEYLLALNMIASIKRFDNFYLQRVVQLINKSNQFNLTTKRYTEPEIEEMMEDNNYICLYGKLEDKFGDNGVVSVVIGRKQKKELHIDLWLMSCRVLKRDMEYAMLDRLVEEARECGINTLYGYYYKTVKNTMVKELYKSFGFKKINEKENEDSVWKCDINNYVNKNNVIKVVKYNDKN